MPQTPRNLGDVGHLDPLIRGVVSQVAHVSQIGVGAHVGLVRKATVRVRYVTVSAAAIRSVDLELTVVLCKPRAESQLGSRRRHCRELA